MKDRMKELERDEIATFLTLDFIDRFDSNVFSTYGMTDVATIRLPLVFIELSASIERRLGDLNSFQLPNLVQSTSNAINQSEEATKCRNEIAGIRRDVAVSIIISFVRDRQSQG